MGGLDASRQGELARYGGELVRAHDALILRGQDGVDGQTSGLLLSDKRVAGEQMLEAAGAVLVLVVVGGVGITTRAAATLDRGASSCNGRGLSGRIEHNLAHDAGIVPHGILHPVDLLEGVPGGGNLVGGHFVSGGNLIDVLGEGIGYLTVGVVVGIVLALVRAGRRRGCVRER